LCERAREPLSQQMPLHPPDSLGVAHEGMRPQATVAIDTLAAQGQLDRPAEQEGTQLGCRRELGRPLPCRGADIDSARHQGAQQAQL
jgi:hypothetical protein